MFGWIILSLIGTEYILSLLPLFNISIPIILTLLSPIVTLLDITALILVRRKKLIPKRSFLLPITVNFIIYCCGIAYGLILALDHEGLKKEILTQNNQQQFLLQNYPGLYYSQWTYSIILISVWAYAIYYYGMYHRQRSHDVTIP